MTDFIADDTACDVTGSETTLVDIAWTGPASQAATHRSMERAYPFDEQTTIAEAVTLSGIGLHSGADVTMQLSPAAPDTGILFRRTDIDASAKNQMVPARWDTVADTRLNTTIANEDGVSVGTVEHLMSALTGCGLDNLIIDIDGPEVPVMDGSAEPFVAVIDAVGLQGQGTPRAVLEILKPVVVREGDKLAALYPADRFSLTCRISFDNPVIGTQTFDVSMAGDAFKAEICRARTFGFMHEVDQLRAAGLARGGSLDNAVVIDGDQVLNEDGLRYRDEMVRHKILDAVGDLSLAGHAILGRFEGVCCGHAMNNKLLHALFADPDAWRVRTRPNAGLTQPAPGRSAGWVVDRRAAADLSA